MGYNFRSSGVSVGLSISLVILILFILQGQSWMKLPLIYSFCFLSIHNTKKQIWL